MSKPVLIITEENSRSMWALCRAACDVLKAAGQEPDSNRMTSMLIQIHLGATEEQVLELIGRFVNLETEAKAMAKTRAQSKMPKVDLVKASELALEYKTDAEKTEAYITDLAVASDKQYAAAASMCADVMRQAKEIDEKRVSFVGPLNEVVKNLNAFFKAPLEHLDKCEEILKKKLGAYVSGEAKKRNQLLIESGKADNEAYAEELIERAEAHMPPKLAGVSMRTTWKGEVVDASKIPAAYLIPDLKALNAMTKAKAGDPGIDGWKATPTTKPAITVSEVKS